MKKLLLMLLGIFPPAAMAGPYFHYAALHEVQAGLFAPVAGPAAGAQAGGILPVFVHDPTDGYLLIPGLGYDLLDLGFSGHSLRDARLGLGPSVRMDGPAKAILRLACTYLPGWSTRDANGNPQAYGLLRQILSEDASGPTLALGLMPMADAASIVQAINDGKPKEITGGLYLSATLSKKFGGS